MPDMQTTGAIPGVLTCEDDHLHCQECGDIVSTDGMPILLIPYTHADTGEKAYGAVCPACSVNVILTEVIAARKRLDQKGTVH
jgi:hypothetical protein